jgi:hypothetical protein
MAEIIHIGEEDLEDQDQEQNQGLSDDELQHIIESEIAGALGQLDDETSQSRDQAFDYFYGKLPAPPRDISKSPVVSTDVADAIDSTVAAIMPAFTQDQVAEFEPEGPDDEDQAQQETEYCNYLVMKAHSGFGLLQQALIDAALLRNGAVKVWTEEKVKVSYEDHTQVPEMALPQLVDDETEVIGYEQGAPIEQMSPAGPVQLPTLNLSLKRYSRQQELRIDPMPIEELLVNADHAEVDLQDARFVAHHCGITASDLVAMGIPEDEVNELDQYDVDFEPTKWSRQRRVSRRSPGSSEDQSTEEKDIYECYLLVDYDGDGIAERRKVLYSSGRILQNEPCDVVNVATGVIYLVPHRWQGRSLFDKLKQVQDAKTEILRQVIDAGRLNINQRLWAVENKVFMDDLLESATGGVVKVRAPDAVGALPQTSLPPESWSMLEYMDKMRRESGGSAIDSAVQAQQVSGDTAHGIERTMSAIEQINANVSEVFSETLIRQLFLLVHYHLRKYSQGPVQYQSNGQWKQVDPRQWKPRNRVGVKVGLSHNERAQRTAALDGVISAQTTLLQQGSPLTDLTKLHNAIIDSTRASGLDAPERYWIDPESEEGQRSAMSAQQQQLMQMQQQQQQLEAQLRQLEALTQAEMAKGQAAQMKAQNDALKLRLDAVQKGIDGNWDREKFYREQLFKYDELEAKEAVDVPGEGTSG